MASISQGTPDAICARNIIVGTSSVHVVQEAMPHKTDRSWPVYGRCPKNEADYITTFSSICQKCLQLLYGGINLG